MLAQHRALAPTPRPGPVAPCLVADLPAQTDRAPLPVRAWLKQVVLDVHSRHRAELAVGKPRNESRMATCLLQRAHHLPDPVLSHKQLGYALHFLPLPAPPRPSISPAVLNCP